MTSKQSHFQKISSRQPCRLMERMPENYLTGIDLYLPREKREEIYFRSKAAQAARKGCLARELLLQMLLDRIQ
ncbi:MAG: hypothetical protein ACOYM3_23765 [Terrimicrobiaceae bacterium]